MMLSSDFPQQIIMTQVEALEAELSGARKSAAGQATELAALSKRLSDGLARSAKLDDKVGVPAFTKPMPACAHHCAEGCAGIKCVCSRWSRATCVAAQT